MPHIFRTDLRIQTTQNIIKALQKPFKEMCDYCINEDIKAWDLIYADEAEHIVGTTFIVLQNYINSSISDLYPSLKQQYTKYQEGVDFIPNYEVTQIQLIVAMANYYKHRDAPEDIKQNTRNPLVKLSIDYIDFNEEKDSYSHKLGADSPLFEGLSILNKDWKLDELLSIVIEWRENMWFDEENTR